MIIVMNPNAPQAAIDRVVAEIERMGARPHLSQGKFRTVIGAVGEEGTLDQNHLAVARRRGKSRPDHEAVQARQPRVSRGGQRRRNRRREVGSASKVKVGGTHAACIAGPCAVENEEMLNKIARHVRDGGATILRGGVFKPRTSPYSFQGLGLEALEVDARPAATSWACRSASR